MFSAKRKHVRRPKSAPGAGIPPPAPAGVMGGAVADALLGLGYPVSAWTRNTQQKVGAVLHPGSPSHKRLLYMLAADTQMEECSLSHLVRLGAHLQHQHDGSPRSPALALLQEGVACFHGQAQLQHFAGSCSVLVCLLPLTPTTAGILNAELLSWLPQGGLMLNPLGRSLLQRAGHTAASLS